MKETVYLGKYVVKQENAYSGNLSLDSSQINFILPGIVNFDTHVLLIVIDSNGKELGKIIINRGNINRWGTKTIVDSYTGLNKTIHLLSYLPDSPFYYGG